MTQLPLVGHKLEGTSTPAGCDRGAVVWYHILALRSGELGEHMDQGDLSQGGGSGGCVLVAIHCALQSRLALSAV